MEHNENDHDMTRRRFVRIVGVSGAAVLAPTLLPGCGSDAKNPQGGTAAPAPPDSGVLVIESYLGDTGARPLSGSTPFWETGAIWMVKPPDALTQLTTVHTDDQVIICVQIHNTSKSLTFPAGGMGLQVYVCAGTQGVGNFSGIASAGGVNGITAPGPNGAPILEIRPGLTQTAYLKWKVGATDADVETGANQKHHCIAANLYWVQGAASEGFPLDPLKHQVIDPPNHRHHAQKNIHIIASTCKAFKLPFTVWNMQNMQTDKPPENEEYAVEVKERIDSNLTVGDVKDEKFFLTSAEQEYVVAQDFVELKGGNPLEPDTRVLTDAEAETLGLPKGTKLPTEPPTRARLAGGGTLALKDGGTLHPAKSALKAVVLAIGDKAGSTKEAVKVGAEEVQLQLNIPEDDTTDDEMAGRTRVFEVTQSRTADGEVVGGATFIVLSTTT